MVELLRSVVEFEVLGITVQRYLLAFVAVFCGFLLRKIVTALLGKYALKVTEKTKTKIDDMLVEAVSKPLGVAVFLCGILVASLILQMPDKVTDFVINVFKVVFAVLGCWLLFRLIDVVGEALMSAAGKTESKLDEQLVPLIRKTAKVFVGVVAFVLIVQNMGYSVSGLLAGLGIGGLAVALAAKETLSNLFGSATIFIDKPFRIGDWIKTDDFEGVVEEVGFRSTKVRTFAKTLVTVPNGKLADMVIDNYSRMPKRRVKMTIGVTYDTTAEQMKKAVEAIKRILREHKEVDQEFFLVYFTDFGASSLDIFVYYFTKTTVWEEYLRVREEINLTIMEELEKLGVSIAFPTYTVHLKDHKGDS